MANLHNILYMRVSVLAGFCGFGDGFVPWCFVYDCVDRFSATRSYIYMLLYDESRENRSIFTALDVQLYD